MWGVLAAVEMSFWTPRPSLRAANQFRSWQVEVINLITKLISRNLCNKFRLSANCLTLLCSHAQPGPMGSMHQTCSNKMSHCMSTDSSMREVGLNLAVATMRKGERCQVKVQPKYGYGEQGTINPVHVLFIPASVIHPFLYKCARVMSISSVYVAFACNVQEASRSPMFHLMQSLSMRLSLWTLILLMR